MHKIYGVYRVFPRIRCGKIIKGSWGVSFTEMIGTKRECMAFCKKAAKPLLCLCEIKSVIEWDKKGKMKSSSDAKGEK